MAAGFTPPNHCPNPNHCAYMGCFGGCGCGSPIALREGTDSGGAAGNETKVTHAARRDHSDLMRLYLTTQDVAGLRKLWAHMAPHLPQPKSDYDVQVMMHSARTQSVSMAFKARAYSHQWLLANGLPSHLPNVLRPKAEQMEFNFKFGVGIGMKVAGNDPAKRALAKSIQTAMGHAVEDAFAEKKTELPFLRQQMAAARDKAIRTFGGPQIRVRVRYDFSSLPAPLNDVR